MMTTERITIHDPKSPAPPFHYSPALRCDDFIFVSGQTATDWISGRAASSRLPHAGNDARVEFRYVYDGLVRLIHEAGAETHDAVRIDTFYTDNRLQEGHFAARDDVWGKDPRGKFASTGVQVARFLPDGTRTMMDMIAVRPNGHRPEGIVLDAVAASLIGIPVGVRYGDFIFLSGKIAYDPVPGAHSLDVAPEAAVFAGHWPGYPSTAKAQTRFLLDRIGSMLKMSGSGLDCVVKMQIYLLSADDITFVEEVWKDYFPDNAPARSFVIVDKMALHSGVIEINTIALAKNSKIERRAIVAPNMPKPSFHEPHAVKAGRLLFLSGQYPTDGTGLAASCRRNSDFPFNASDGRLQMEAILHNVDAICRAAGGSLRNVARVQSFFTDLKDFDAAHEVWKRSFESTPPAWTIMQVGGTLPIDGSVLACDVIAYL